MKKFLLLSACFFSSLCINAQDPWVATNAIPAASRYDDISFLNKDTGWAVCAPHGRIYSTKDGGNTWTQQQFVLGVYMRSIEFSSPLRGFAGALETSGQNVFYKTTDGGTTWTDISSVITGTNRGICGICCVDTNITYAVGVWASPAYVMKTTDGGNTWNQINMSAYASRLVDVQFTDANNGYVSGQSNISSEGAVILKTTNGGTTWTKVFTNNKAGDYLWKLQNLDGQHWFASIENASPGNNVILKSSNGGNAWIQKNVCNTSDPSNYLQGVGFMDTLRGWAGYKYLYQTRDGGNSWNVVDSALPAFNRFQKINSNMAYFSGKTVYKLDTAWVGIKELKPLPIDMPELSIFPNPAKDYFTVTLKVDGKTMYNLRIINSNSSGIIWEETGGVNIAGEYKFKINKKLPAGIYFVYVMTNEGSDSKKIVVTD